MATRGPTKNDGNVTVLPSAAHTSQRNAIRSLNCYKEVEEMLKSGIATPVIARFIQQDMGELTEMSVESLGSRLRQWRAQIAKPADLISGQGGGPGRRLLSDSIQKLNKSMNESAALRELLQVQMERIQQGREQEIKDNRLANQTSRDIELAADIVEKHARIRVDLGLPSLKMDEQEDDIESTLEAQYGDVGGSVRKVLTNPDSRRRALGIVEKVAGLAGIRFSGTDALAKLPQSGPTFEQNSPSTEVSETSPVQDPGPPLYDEGIDLGDSGL